MNANLTLGARIFLPRRELGVSQEKFASMHGVARLAALRWEQDADRPATITLLKMAMRCPGASVDPVPFIEEAGLSVAEIVFLADELRKHPLIGGAL